MSTKKVEVFVPGSQVKIRAYQEEPDRDGSGETGFNFESDAVVQSFMWAGDGQGIIYNVQGIGLDPATGKASIRIFYVHSDHVYEFKK